MFCFHARADPCLAYPVRLAGLEKPTTWIDCELAPKSNRVEGIFVFPYISYLDFIQDKCGDSAAITDSPKLFEFMHHTLQIVIEPNCLAVCKMQILPQACAAHYDLSQLLRNSYNEPPKLPSPIVNAGWYLLRS